MQQSNVKRTWVVYRNNHKMLPANAVCAQGEWERMDQEEPGVHTLIKAGIENEGEAERLARGSAGDLVPRATAPKLRRPFGAAKLPEAVTGGSHDREDEPAQGSSAAIDAAA